MDSAEESENFDSFSENEYRKTKCDTPNETSDSNINIVHKLFNREVRLNSRIHVAKLAYLDYFVFPSLS